MKTIKVTGVDLASRRYFSSSNGAFIRENDEIYKFVFNNSAIKKCDYWFIGDSYGLDEFGDNCAVCPKGNVFLIMGEADGVKVYNKDFIKQFLNIVTVQKHDYGVENVYRKYIAEWFVGIDFPVKKKDGVVVYNKGYDELKKMQVPAKTKLVSVISSDKVFTKGHRDRLAFCKKSKQHFGDKIDFFGRGICEFSDKWDVLAPYKYHIAIENFRCRDYITEKFLDSYLAFSYPIYCGAPNVEQYFPRDSFSEIDITCVDEAIQKIEDIIANNYFEKRFDKLVQARNMVLNEYNPLIQMIRLVQAHDIAGSEESTLNCIKSEREFSVGTKIAKVIDRDSLIYKALRGIYHFYR